MSRLKILSLNINGLRNTNKRLQVFRWLKSLDFHLILLQDIHYEENDQELWKTQWSYPSIFNTHNAILSCSTNLSISQLQTDHLNSTNRILCATISSTTITSPFNIASIYIPADRSQRRRFLESLPLQLNIQIDFMAGDCNIISNPALDHIPSSTARQSIDWDLFSSCLQIGRAHV